MKAHRGERGRLQPTAYRGQALLLRSRKRDEDVSEHAGNNNTSRLCFSDNARHFGAVSCAKTSTISSNILAQIQYRKDPNAQQSQNNLLQTMSYSILREKNWSGRCDSNARPKPWQAPKYH